MNLLKAIEIAGKLEKWTDQKIREFAHRPKSVVVVSLEGLLSDDVDALIKDLRIDGRIEWAKVIKEDYEKLQDVTKRATLDLIKRIVEFKIDRINTLYDAVSVSDILNPSFKIPTDTPWKESEIPKMVYFDECAQCAHQLVQTLRQVVKAVEEELVNKEPAVTGENASPAKYWGIGDWFWKLYEKTLKVIVDAVMERMWSK